MFGLPSLAFEEMIPRDGSRESFTDIHEVRAVKEGLHETGNVLKCLFE